MRSPTYSFNDGKFLIVDIKGKKYKATDLRCIMIRDDEVEILGMNHWQVYRPSKPRNVEYYIILSEEPIYPKEEDYNYFVHKNVYSMDGSTVTGSMSTGNSLDKMKTFELSRTEFCLNFKYYKGEDIPLYTLKSILDILTSSFNKVYAPNLYDVSQRVLEPFKYERMMTKEEYENDPNRKLEYERWARDCAR